MFAGLIRVRERTSEECAKASIVSVNKSCPWIVETFNKVLPNSAGYWTYTGKSYMTEKAAISAAKKLASKFNANIV